MPRCEGGNRGGIRWLDLSFHEVESLETAEELALQ
jgi:hypothetical protein